MFEKVAYDGWSGRKVYSLLKHDINFTTESGKHLLPGNIYILLKNHFYCGGFDIPRIHVIDKHSFHERIRKDSHLPKSLNVEIVVLE